MSPLTKGCQASLKRRLRFRRPATVTKRMRQALVCVLDQNTVADLLREGDALPCHTLSFLNLAQFLERKFNVTEIPCPCRLERGGA